MRQYTTGTIDRKEFEGLIFKHILDHHQRFKPHGWKWDDWLDYLCWLYPRLHRAIERYVNKGVSFDAYIAALLRWAAREYRSKKADRAVFEYSFWHANTTDMMTLSEEPEYPETTAVHKPIKNARHLLILILKCYYSASDDFIARAAPLAGIDPKTLCRLIDELRSMRLVRDQDIRDLKARIACQYYRCISFEYRMQAAPENSAHRAEMESRLKKARKRLARMRKHLKAMRKEATNKEVAQVMGVSKGTVDSSMHILKWKWKTFKG
jgi:DNA-directed RNA polymerase specialized sigma24 family protein